MSKAGRAGQLRIIGGEWRGRKLAFPDVEGLRPTPDRVRETLFNWLQMQLPGARCLDLFAGSGALGLEALSRGAAEVVMVEQNARAVTQIHQHLETLGCDSGKAVQADVFAWLNGPATPFDIIFLDPPYGLDCLAQCCRLLEQGGWLQPKAYIYLEDLSQRPPPQLPEHWELLRSKKAGEAGYHLVWCNR